MWICGAGLLLLEIWTFYKMFLTFRGKFPTNVSFNDTHGCVDATVSVCQGNSRAGPCRQCDTHHFLDGGGSLWAKTQRLPPVHYLALSRFRCPGSHSDHVWSKLTQPEIQVGKGQFIVTCSLKVVESCYCAALIIKVGEIAFKIWNMTYNYFIGKVTFVSFCYLKANLIFIPWPYFISFLCVIKNNN